MSHDNNFNDMSVRLRQKFRRGWPGGGPVAVETQRPAPAPAPSGRVASAVSDSGRSPPEQSGRRVPARRCRVASPRGPRVPAPDGPGPAPPDPPGPLSTQYSLTTKLVTLDLRPTCPGVPGLPCRAGLRQSQSRTRTRCPQTAAESDAGSRRRSHAGSARSAAGQRQTDRAVTPVTSHLPRYRAVAVRAPATRASPDSTVTRRSARPSGLPGG